MYTMSDLRAATGYSNDQLRARVRLLRGVVGHDVHRGPRGAIIVGDEFRAALDRMMSLERGGLGPQDARDRIADELRGGNGSNPHPSPASTDVATLMRVIEGLERDRDAWRSLALSLQDRVLALPAPRLPWWRRLFASG